MLIQVVKTHLEGSNFQQGVARRAGALLLGQGTTLHQTDHRRLCAARQELGPKDVHLAQVGHLREMRHTHRYYKTHFFHFQLMYRVTAANGRTGKGSKNTLKMSKDHAAVQKTLLLG